MPQHCTDSDLSEELDYENRSSHQGPMNPIVPVPTIISVSLSTQLKSVRINVMSRPTKAAESTACALASGRSSELHA